MIHTSKDLVSFSLVALSRRARWVEHWKWLDGMAWIVLDGDAPGVGIIKERGYVGLGELPEAALPDLTNQDTVAMIADRVRYLFDLPELVCVYEERLNMYRVTLPDGRASARYSPAGAWVGLLELYSYTVSMKRIGRSS